MYPNIMTKNTHKLNNKTSFILSIPLFLYSLNNLSINYMYIMTVVHQELPNLTFLLWIHGRVYWTVEGFCESRVVGEWSKDSEPLWSMFIIEYLVS